jgi:hypothetical protein
MKKLFTVLTSLGLLAFAQASFAHHSTNGIYAEDKDLELKGTVKEWRFVNPHPLLKLLVVDDKGVEHEWDVSYGGSAVAHLKRRGYDEKTFKPGDKIIVTGKPALAKDIYALLMEGSNPTREDGTPIVNTSPNAGLNFGPPPAPAGR